MALIICSVTLGMIVAMVSAYFLMTFSNKIFKVFLSLVDLSSGSIVFIFHKYFDVVDQNMKLWSTSAFYLSFMICLLMTLYAMCMLIKDKNDKDMLRIRDILLGQKDYILSYYKMRKAQIDEKLKIPLLESREKKVKEQEEALLLEKEHIERNRAVIQKMGKRKIKIVLPDHKDIYINQEFIDKMPAFFDAFSNCISSFDQYTQNEINDLKTLDLKAEDVRVRFEAFLINIETNVLSSLFGNSSQVRVHFRKYNREKKEFEVVSAITGKEGKPIFVSHLTPIPYKDSMIEKSFECKRAIIKSINASSTRYNGVNSAVWQDYMTYTFYNICHQNVPCLSFGISVKNEENYRDLFYFLNYAKFENYLSSCLERFNDIVNISDIFF